MDFKQTSFSGGINLLLDDTRLPLVVKAKEGNNPYDATYSQYRLGLNCRNRFDVIDPIPLAVEDTEIAPGIKQGILTFGNYIICFVKGSAWYRLKTSVSWTLISTFSMSQTAPRFWFVTVPLATTNYGRIATADTVTGLPTPNLPVNQVNQIAGTFGNLPGLLVQDGIHQPQFIYLTPAGPVSKVTQTYAQWTYDPTGVNDRREYVPIGTYMEWFNGILFVTDTNYNFIYRSVSGRPLDFVLNVDLNGNKGGDATTTSYSVGVGGITALRAMPGNLLFVAAGQAACFGVTLNTTPNAPTLFGEYTFLRTPLFNANCVSEKGIIDILGDSVFIDANGLRSFNAVLQQQNEGRNSIFSSAVTSLFDGVFQHGLTSAAIVFDNYAIFSVNTTFGYVLIIYDTINNCYSSLDTTQVGNHAVKQFAKIEIDFLSLFCITDDNKVYELYANSSIADTTIRLGALANTDPRKELKITSVRAILINITQDCQITCSIFTNNRLDQELTTKIKYTPPVNTWGGVPLGNDIGTQTTNFFFTFPNSGQGWKAFAVLSWTGGGSLTSVYINTSDETPLQSPVTQAVVRQIP